MPSFLDRMKAIGDDFKTAASKFMNKNLLESTMAACAMVCNANGVVKPEEKQKMIGAIRLNEALQAYDLTEVVGVFEKCLEPFNFDLGIGKADALKKVGKIKGKEDEAKLLVRICCAIGASDGDFDDDEKQCVREICTELGLSPSTFGL